MPQLVESAIAEPVVRTPGQIPVERLLRASRGHGPGTGGRMRQEIFDDEHRFADWEFAHRARCFVHIANSLVCRAITGEDAPGVPPTAAEYTRAGLPWFDDYTEDRAALAGSDRLKQLRSVMEIGTQKVDVPLLENESGRLRERRPPSPSRGTAPR